MDEAIDMFSFQEQPEHFCSTKLSIHLECADQDEFNDTTPIFSNVVCRGRQYHVHRGISRAARRCGQNDNTVQDYNTQGRSTARNVINKDGWDARDALCASWVDQLMSTTTLSASPASIDSQRCTFARYGSSSDQKSSNASWSQP